MPPGVDKIVKSLKEANPSWTKSRLYATAWSIYKKEK
jgi:hypothetical protein